MNVVQASCGQTLDFSSILCEIVTNIKEFSIILARSITKLAFIVL